MQFRQGVKQAPCFIPGGKVKGCREANSGIFFSDGESGFVGVIYSEDQFLPIFR